MVTHESFPIIVVEGEPFERGKQQGAQVPDRIAQTIEIHRRSIRHYTGMEWPAAVECALPYLPVLQSYVPEMVEELHGIAEGSGQRFEDILTLNVRAELTFTPSMAQGCTSFAVLPEASADGHTYLGQTWDNLVDLTDTCIVLKVQQHGRPNYVAVTEAGAPGMVGFNAAGVGVVRNALVSPARAEGPAVPVNAVHYRIFSARNIGEATAAIVASPLATSWFYMIGAPGDAMGFEVAPPRFDYLTDERGILTHANHFVSRRLDVEDLGPKVLPDTLFRDRRLRRQLDAGRGSLSSRQIMDGLRDHFNFPSSICRHPDERVPADGRMATVFAVVMDLDERVMYLCEGEPCRSSGRSISLW